MKVQEFADKHAVDLEAVCVHVQELRGLSRKANVSADLTPEEESDLREKFNVAEASEESSARPSSPDTAPSGGGRRPADAKSDAELFRVDEEAWHARMQELREMEDRIDAKLRRAGDDAGGEKPRDPDLTAVVKLLQTAATQGPNALNRVRQGSGKMIQVNAGDTICHRPNANPGDKVQGGWFKCSEDQSVSIDVNIVAVAQEPFSYDSALGAPAHAVKYTVHKRYYQNGDFPVVRALDAARQHAEAKAKERRAAEPKQPVF